MAAIGVLAFAYAAAAGPSFDPLLTTKVAEIETRLEARVGASVIDTQTGAAWGHRADERFPLTSTFKAFACAGVLRRVDAGKDDLARKVIVERSDLVTYSPVTERHVGGDGLTLSALCEAATAVSDNSAGNLVLESLGGPADFTAFMRSIGDGKTRLDRRETHLNDAEPGDPRDTTTPGAAASSLRELVLGEILATDSRRQLAAWLLRGNQVGGPLLRASLPDGWQIADRTGAGGFGSRSVAAVIWPPERAPLVVAIYVTETDASMDERNRAIGEIGEALVEAVSG